MRKHKRLLLFAMSGALAAAALVYALLGTPTAITRENAMKIEKCMTVAQVEEILGGPPRDEAPELAEARLIIQSVRPDLEWSSDQVSVWVHLDADGRVKESHANPAHRPQGPLATLRRWFGR